MNPNNQKNGWLLKLAWKDAQRSFSRLSLLIVSIVLGVAAIVSVLSFSENLQAKINLDSKELLGADYVIDSRYEPSEKIQFIMDSLGGPDVSEINFLTMAFFPVNESSKLISLSGFEGQYPVYGDLITSPENAATSYQKDQGAIIDRTILIQMNLEIGDSIRLGNVILPIIGVIEEVSGKSIMGSTFAPPVFIPLGLIDKTGLIQIGSRVEYQYYFRLKEGQVLGELDKELDLVLDIEGADLDTHETSNQRVGRSIRNIKTFLAIIGFVSLLLSCVGIASAVEYYLKDKHSSMATLKCLGFFQRSVFKIYLIQILGVGFLGGVFGGLAGVSIQQVFPLFLQNFLPVELDFSIQPIVLLVGIVAGILMALLFSLLPLLKTLKVSPIQVLRDQSAFFKVSFKTRSIVYLLIGAFVFIGSYILLHDVFISSVFLGSLLLVFVLLNSISSMFLLILRKLQLKRRGIVVKYGVKSIFRPGNQTKVLLLSIGMASFLIASITSLQSMLMEQTKVGDVSNQANMLLIDVQRDQVKGIEKKLTNKNLKLFNNVPIVSIRINKINGRSISELRRDSLLNIKDWILNNEYRVTYTDSLDEGEEVIEGTWIGTFHEKGEWIPISVADYFLRDAQVNLGDSIIWNVQGVNMKTIIRSVRVINWSSLDLKFTILFPKGVLEKAPQVNILATKISSDKESAEIQNTLVKSYPNLSVIDLRRTLKLVGEILTKISWVLQFMTIFTILIGVFILIGTIRATKYQRIKENALLRTLGAKGNQVLKISMIEFSVIAIIGSFSGLMLSILSAYALAVYGFKIPFSIPFFTLVFILAISVLLVLLLGLLNNLKAIRTKPLQVLKG